MDEQAAREKSRASEDRLLHVLEYLQSLPVTAVDAVLHAAAQRVAEAFDAHKVDIFLLDDESATLVARGTSDTPMGRKQHALGLHRLPLVNGGRAVAVFRTGTSWHDDHADHDTEELLGIREVLGIRSTIAVPLQLGGEFRGVIQANDARPEFFAADDLRRLEVVAGWVELLAERSKVAEVTASEERITILAHDFRTPLSAIELALGLLASHAGQQLQAGDRELLSIARRNTRRLALLVEDLLATRQLEAGGLDIRREPVDLREVIKEAAQAVTPLLTEKEQVLTLAVPTTLPVRGDARRLGQVIANLLSNAHRHTPRGSHITVGGDAVGNEVRLSVRDNGPGIPPDELERVFLKHHRLGTTSGSGIGLALVRELVERHGGRAWAEHVPEGGAEFHVTLPYRPTS